jgi:exodeoxyribonuclease VII small subunit
VADAPKFEDGLADLEKLVAELETGDLGLDEALKRFEKGVKIAGQLQGALEASNRKVEKLASGGSLEAFDGDGDAEPEAKPKKAAKKKSDQDTTLF